MIIRRLIYTAIAACITTTTMAAEPWLYSGRIAGTYIYNSISDADLVTLLDQRAAENASILELDSRLSYYLTDAEFDTEVAFLDRAAKLANDRGMQTVIYYPTLEVLTTDGVTAASTMAKDHPDWVQQGIDGTANVFYGNQEVWVSPGEESAWMSPNTGYRDYFIDRIKKLAATDLGGVWLDVPIYLDTGTPWTGAEPAAAADFQAWTIAEGLNNGSGYTVPTVEDVDDPGFKAWIKWRHINMASFLEDIRDAAQAVNPNFSVIIENFPMDYFDSTAYALDPSYLEPSGNMIHVWETDSVSNTTAMKWSTPDDFENKIAMLKWARSVHKTQPSWSFSYGYEPLDAGLTLAATVAAQHVPFESQTPGMLTSVDTNFRANWFGYVRDHEEELLRTPREAQLGIWYSSSTRDYQDYGTSGRFGIYSVTTPPTTDDTWWAQRPEDSVTTAPHLGGYRGISAAMIRMHIPYEVVHARDTGPLADASDLDMLVLPSVGAMSDADAEYIRQYAQAGGVVLATGLLPGTLDENGATRAQSAIADLFAFPGAPAKRVNKFGDGLVIYRPDIVGTTLFGEQLDANAAADTLSEIERLVRIHVEEPYILENGEDVYADHSIVDENEHLLTLVNYSGLQLPLVPAVKPVTIYFNAPEGKQVSNIVASTPDANGLNGFATVINRGDGVFKIDVPVDQFALLEIILEDAPVVNTDIYAGPQFEDPAHATAAQSGLAFVLNSMRNSTLPEPNRFGVHTNLIDNNDSTAIYTNGHNVTGEHMGLLLRTSACMGNESAYNEAYRYVSELMQSPLYHVPNWSIDKNAQRPFLFFDDFRNNWFNANAPLDDLRLIHGLIDGYENFGRNDANALADSMFEGLYWTSITDRSRNTNTHLFPQYDDGLLGFAWDWSEVDDNSLTPAATATGDGYLGTDLLPVDYQDLGAIAHAAARDHRWAGVLQSTTQLLLDSEINLSGLYYNGYKPDGTFTGDFEYQGTRRGEHLKVIQVLWTAIHLARASKAPTDALTTAQKSLAQGSAARSLAFFKNFYQANNRVPEYLKFSGADVDDCVGGLPADCLGRGTESLFNGEARIYAQMARLALLLGDKEFSNQIINEKIITDRISDTADARYGLIGLSTTGTNDAEAWNVLESVFSICLNAVNEDDGGPPVSDNNAPVAVTDNFTTNEETPLTLTAATLLANDTDADNDTLNVSGLPSRSANGGSIQLLQSGDWLYTPATGFNGLDTVSYAISDGRGGSAIGELSINVLLVPKTKHLTESVTILNGTLFYGSIEFLTNDDADTYDVTSTPATQGNVVDIYISGRVANRNEVTRLQASYAGHYSVPGVTQETFLYNFTDNEWVSVDTRVVGDESDSIVLADITDDANSYIAADGETRMRIQGTHPTLEATIWANSVNWTAYRGSQSTGNTAPVTSSVSVSTTMNTAASVNLTASDADNDPLVYTVDATGLSGTISGAAPELTYTPAAGFIGNDTFSFTVSDGELTSNLSIVTITVLETGIISNLAATITLDGDLTDWTGYIPFAADPRDVTGTNNLIDWRQAWMAHDGGNYYLAYRNDVAVNPTWGQTVYFDIDNNAATGLQNGLPIGADRVLQGRFLYSYAGTGTNWAWDFITEVVGSSANGNFEYRFPRTALNDSEQIALAFVGSSEPHGGTAEDLYPDGVYDTTATTRNFSYTAVAPGNSAPMVSDLEGLTNQNVAVALTLIASDADNDALTYTVLNQPQHGTLTGTAPDLSYQPSPTFTGTDSFTFQVSDGQALSRVATASIIVQAVDQSDIPSNPVTQLIVDGTLSDWQALQYFENDPNDITGAENPVDYLRAAMAHDAEFFYLTFSNDGQDLAALDDWLFTVYIDTDLDPATGYQSGLAIGADFMQQGTGVYSYAGTGQDWTWSAAGASIRQASGSDVELTIPRQLIGDPSNIRLTLIGDNFSANGSVSDAYPDGMYDATAAIRYLEYQTGGLPSVPVALAALGSIQDPVSGTESLKANARELTRESELEANRPISVTTGTGAIGVGGLMLLLFVTARRRTRAAA